MKHMEIKQDNRTIFIPNESIGDYDVLFDNNTGNRVLSDYNSWASMCINCHNPKCIHFHADEIKCDRFDLSQLFITTVCPLDAIAKGKESIIINKDKCVGCGICASRCPFGAISIKDNKAVVSVADGKIIPSYPETNQNVKKQQLWIDSSRLKNKIGQICDDSVLRTLLIEKGKDDKIRISSTFREHLILRNLVLSLLIQLGYTVQFPRIGNTSERMDCVFQIDKRIGVVEVEAGEDILDVPRNLLDDVAMIQYRQNISKEDIIPLHICFKLQNRRSEYWRIINDINKICNIKINTITIGAMFLLMWNFVTLNDIKQFYFDSEIINDKTTMRLVVEEILGRAVLNDKDIRTFFESEK